MSEQSHRRAPWNCVVSLLIGAVLLTGSGCALMHPVRPTTDPSRPTYSRMKSGQFVVLHLHDGRRVELVVDRIEPDAIVAADGRRYANNEIRKAEVRRLTKGEVAVVSVLIGAGVFVYMFVQAVGKAIGEAGRFVTMPGTVQDAPATMPSNPRALNSPQGN